MTYVVLRMKEVIAKTGMQRTNLYRQVKAKTFPQPISLGAKAVGWVESEVDAWIETRMKARHQGAGADASRSI